MKVQDQAGVGLIRALATKTGKETLMGKPYFALITCFVGLITLVCYISPEVEARAHSSEIQNTNLISADGPIHTDSDTANTDRFVLNLVNRPIATRPIRMARRAKRNCDRHREANAARYKGHNPRRLPR